MVSPDLAASSEGRAGGIAFACIACACLACACCRGGASGLCKTGLLVETVLLSEIALLPASRLPFGEDDIRSDTERVLGEGTSNEDCGRVVLARAGLDAAVWVAEEVVRRVAAPRGRVAVMSLAAGATALVLAVVVAALVVAAVVAAVGEEFVCRRPAIMSCRSRRILYEKGMEDVPSLRHVFGGFQPHASMHT